MDTPSAPELLYEDNHLLVIAKPAGTPTVPDASGDVSLLDVGKAYLKRTRHKPGTVFLGVVHRLDRPVSGVVCFATTSKAAGRLAAQFRAGTVEKTYLAVTTGTPQKEQGLLEHALMKDSARNLVQAFSPDQAPQEARLARTHWRVLAHLSGFTLLELIPETGRPHQLRVQCAAMGCPLLGDVKYGASALLSDRCIALHAQRLILQHPTRNERMAFVAPLPEGPVWKSAKDYLSEAL